VFVIDQSLEIEAPAETLWSVLTDFPAYGEWNPFVPDCRCDLRPGGAIDMHVRLGRKPQWQREWILEVRPGQSFSYRMKPLPMGLLRSLRVHRIEAMSPGRCRYESHFEIAGFLQPLVTGLLGGKLQRGFAEMAAGLKRHTESKWAQRG
jgi:uncharacterized protein YndB with AHSA1/START domain